VESPLTVGVPLIVPELDNARPVGRAPLVMDQVYGGTPPVALKAVEYAVKVRPCGSAAAVAIVSAELTLIWKLLLAVCAGVPPVTWTLKLKVPDVVGVPLMRPDAAKAKPGGRLPEVTDQVSADCSDASSCFE
jgi:hypothetical protein